MTARVALYGSGGAPHHAAAVLAAGGHQVRFVEAAEIADGALEAFDVFVLPGGAARATEGLLAPLRPAAREAIASFLEDGGMVIGICAGAIAAIDPGGLGLSAASIFEQPPGEPLGLRSPGIGVLEAAAVDPGHPLVASLPSTEPFRMLHYNGPLLVARGEVTPVVALRGATPQFTTAGAFLAPRQPDEMLARAAAAGAALVTAEAVGEGRLVLFGSHPDLALGPGLDRWIESAELLPAAAAWQLACRAPRQGPMPRLAAHDPRYAEASRAVLIGEAVAHLVEIRRLVGKLRAAGRSPWLHPSRALSLAGERPSRVWAAALDEIEAQATEISSALASADITRLGYMPQPTADGGHAGVTQLLRHAVKQLTQARQRWSSSPPPGAPLHAYAELASSPYHLVAGSYVGAIGTVTAAALICGLPADADSPAAAQLPSHSHSASDQGAQMVA